jgi:hypothetical protein
MIRQPDSGARPSVTVAATGFLALPVCLGAGLSQWGTGGYPGSTSVAAGCLIVAGIMAVPFAVGLLARVAPGLLAPWVPGDGLFFRAVRACLFLVGFVLLYQVVGVVLSQELPSGWETGSALAAAGVLGIVAWLNVGPWRQQGGRNER